MSGRHGRSGPLPRTVVLVGLMGAGKSSVGKLLAREFNVGFVDADREIEESAQCTIAEFFARFGEDTFRRTEEQTIRRLLSGPARILATGGGAFMSPLTRGAIRENALSLWLRADLDTLFERVSRRSDRPLLRTSNPRGTLEGLMLERYPVYADADLIIDSQGSPIEETVARACTGLQGFFEDPRRTPT